MNKQNQSLQKGILNKGKTTFSKKECLEENGFTIHFTKICDKKVECFPSKRSTHNSISKKSFYYGKMGFADTAEQIVQFFFLEMVKMEIHP